MWYILSKHWLKSEFIVVNTDGSWGSWGEWSSCDGYGTECAHGSEKFKTRVCDNPVPLGDGADCPGGKRQEMKIGTSWMLDVGVWYFIWTCL